jgi:hypothetical protein
MKTKGEGFKYVFNGVEVKDFDEFEKLIKNKDVEINVENLVISAKTKV